jgi:hypothetical protein
VPIVSVNGNANVNSTFIRAPVAKPFQTVDSQAAAQSVWVNQAAVLAQRPYGVSDHAYNSQYFTQVGTFREPHRERINRDLTDPALLQPVLPAPR